MNTSLPAKIGLVQIGDRFGDQYYLPYAIGILQAYAQSRLADPAGVKFGIPLYYRTDPDEAVRILAGSHMLFFSVYLWNYALSIEIARRYKERYPETIIIFGGPQVPENRQRLAGFMAEHRFIDLACYGEGEESFLQMLEHRESRSWDKVPGVAFHHMGEIIITSRPPVLEDLELIPSPYLTGVFDPLIALTGTQKWSALIETNRGCPFTCAFCYWGAGVRRKLRTYSLKRIMEEVDWFSKNNIEFLFCCDANFGILERDNEIVDKIISCKSENGFPKAFSIQSTKNSTTSIYNLQRRLNQAGLQKGVNLALQSLYPPTLKAISRSNISSEVYGELLALFNNAGIPAFSDIILGLPEETYDSYINGIEQLINQGQHTRIQFINLTVLENTAMADQEYINLYGLELIDSIIVSHHTSLQETSCVAETQKLVIGSRAMPQDKWVKARIFSWVLSLFYYDRLLQIPFLLLARLGGVGIRSIVEHFISCGTAFPVTGNLIEFISRMAKAVATGKPEYVASVDYLNIWWQVDEYLMIQLIRDSKLDLFYEEALKILEPLATSLPLGIVEDALHLSRHLLKEPFANGDLELTLSYQLPEIHSSLQRGKLPEIRKGKFRYRITRNLETIEDWNVWMREVIWYGSKKGDYLFSIQPIENCKGA